MSDDGLLHLAAAILDGEPIDWSAAAEATEQSGGALLDQLRAIARITDVHRAPIDAAPDTWGEFAILEPVGSGTFGDVYRARDTALDRDVALKLLRTPRAGGHPAEGRLLARVRHPNIVTVHGAAEHDGVYGIWMEFVRGRTLAALVEERGPFPATEVIAIARDLCGALAAVHAAGLLHGDIKAQNVMQESGGRIVLMDFGTGRITGDDAFTGLAGTPLYVAPEVLAGEPPDASSDVYSLGVMLHLLLTGRFPVEGATLRDIRTAHAQRAGGGVRSKRPDLPRRIAGIVDRATAPKAERFQTAAALQAALASAATPAIRRPVVLAAAVALAILAIGTWRVRTAAFAVDDLRVRVTTSAITATDGAGREMWRYVFPNRYIIGLSGFGTGAQVVGGRSPAVFAVIGGRTRRSDDGVEGGELMELSPQGTVRRTFSFDDRVTFAGRAYGAPWAITTLAVDDRTASRRIAVAAHHFQWSASMVTLLDDRFARHGTYWQWGWIESLAWLAPDRLFIGGYNDVHQGGMVALLDPSHLDGQAPEPVGVHGYCDTCGKDAPLRMVVMPPTEINTATVSRFNRAVIQVMPDRIIARTIEMEQTDTHPAIDVLYEFSKSLDLIRASFGGNYWEMHAALEKQGKLTHTREQCPDRDGPREVLVWTPERGWQPVAVPHPSD